MRIKLSFLAIFALLMIVALLPARAQTSPTMVGDPIPIGQIGGTTSTVAFNGGNLYFNVGPRLARMAISDSTPLTPTLPPTYGGILAGIPEDIKVANGYLYVALGQSGVAVVDPVTLQALSVQQLPGAAFANAVAVSSQRLYVAGGADGIFAYDLGVDKKTLTYAQTKAFTAPVRSITDVEVRSIGGGEYLFVSANNFAAAAADRGGVMKFDITVSPVLGLPVDTLQLDINALVATDSFVFAAGDDALYALDTAEIGTTGGMSSTVALTFRGLEVALRPGDDTAYVVNAIGGIDVVDIGTPSPAPALSVIGSLFSNDYINDVVSAEFPSDSNTYLYLADSGSGLSIASAPQATPQNLNLDRPSYVMPKPGIASIVAGAFPQAYVYSIPSNQWTINTTNIDGLSAIGNGIVPATAINAIAPYSNSLLISTGPDGVARYLANPGTEPVYSDTVGTSGVAYDTAVTWPYAVVANGDSGLAVLDISDPMTMTLIGSAPSPAVGAFTHVAVQGNYAYVADDGGVIATNGTLRVYDLTDPALPAPTGSVSQTGILDVKVSGNLAFLAVGPHGIRVADISNPTSPVIIDTDDYTGTTSASSLAIYGHYLFVTGGANGVQMLTFDPATGQLGLIATVPTAGAATQLTWVQGYLYVADDTGGLYVIQIGDDVSITKTAPASAYAGQSYTYTLQVNNVGAGAVTGVVITDVLPVEVSLISAQNCATGGGVVTCTVPSLAVNANATFNVVVKSDVTDVISNTAVVTSNELDVNTANNNSSATTTIMPAVDLALSKIDMPDPVYVGSRLAYTLTVTNNGPSNATGVVVTDTLPAGVTLASAGAGCAGTTTLVCNVGALDNGANATVSIAVTVTTGASSFITNTALATANEVDFTPATANASTTVLPVADLSLIKTEAPDPAVASQPLTYTLVVNNLGPSAASNVVLTDTLSPKVQLVSVSAGGCSGSSDVVCNLGTLNANGVVTVTIVVVPTVGGFTLDNSATVMSDVHDPNPSNNSAGPVMTPVKARIFFPVIRR